MRPILKPIDRSFFSALWLFGGSVAVPAGSDYEQIMDALEAKLHDQGVRVFREPDPAIWFSNFLFRFSPNWKTMVLFDRGWAWFDERNGDVRLRYQVRSFHGFLFCLSFALFVVSVAWLAEGPTGACTGLGMFGWLYGMNMALSAVRVPDFFSSAVRQL